MNESTEIVRKACDFLEAAGLHGNTIYSFIQTSSHRIEIISYHSDDTVFSRDNFKKALGVIVHGELASSKKVGGGELFLRTLKSGDIFGVAGLFENQNHYVSEIVAVSDCTVVYFSEEQLMQLFTENPICAISYIQLLSKKIRYLNAKIDGFASPNAYGKLAMYLYENNGYHGTMSSLSETLGMSRMTLYRNLDILISEGYVVKDGKHIEVCNPELLLLFDSTQEIL